MAAVISLTTHFTVTLGDIVYEGGSLTEPVTITLSADLPIDRTEVIADAGTHTYWTDNVGGFGADFLFLWAMSSAGTDTLPVILQLSDGAAGAGDTHEVPLLANVPVVIRSDDVDGATIGKVAVKNNSGGSATVRVAIFA